MDFQDPFLKTTRVVGIVSRVIKLRFRKILAACSRDHRNVFRESLRRSEFGYACSEFPGAFASTFWDGSPGRLASVIPKYLPWG